jgi:hypothetical protein
MNKKKLNLLYDFIYVVALIFIMIGFLGWFRYREIYIFNKTPTLYRINILNKISKIGSYTPKLSITIMVIGFLLQLYCGYKFYNINNKGE